MDRYSTAFVTGFAVAAVSFTGWHLRAEVIRLNACRPGNVPYLDEYGNHRCRWPDIPGAGSGRGQGSGPRDPDDRDRDRDDGEGGRRDSDPADPADPIEDCNECNVQSVDCFAASVDAEETCRRAAIRVAEWRCDPNNPSTLTPWGASIGEMPHKGAEYPWSERSRWVLSERSTGPWTPPIIVGPGVDSCKTTWMTSHPSGSESLTTGAQGAFEWGGLKANGGVTIASSVTWTAKVGWRIGCATLMSDMTSQCVTAESTCREAAQCRRYGL